MKADNGPSLPAANITFFTAMAWNTDRHEDWTEDFEPGANQAEIGAILTGELENTYLDIFETQGKDSPLGLELQHRFEFMSEIWNYHQWHYEMPLWTSWGTIRGPTSTSATNNTTNLGKGSTAAVPTRSPLNFTSWELGNVSSMGCGTSVDGSADPGCSIARRRRARWV